MGDRGSKWRLRLWPAKSMGPMLAEHDSPGRVVSASTESRHYPGCLKIRISCWARGAMQGGFCAECRMLHVLSTSSLCRSPTRMAAPTVRNAGLPMWGTRQGARVELGVELGVEFRVNPGKLEQVQQTTLRSAW